MQTQAIEVGRCRIHLCAKSPAIGIGLTCELPSASEAMEKYSIEKVRTPDRQNLSLELLLPARAC